LTPGDIVVAVIGPRWIGPVDGGRTRIFDEKDPVRVEIETAMRRGITIVPVLVGGAAMPAPDDLPEAIKEFSYFNAAEVDDGRDFHQHMQRVLRSIDDLLYQKSPAAKARRILQRKHRLAFGACAAVVAIATVVAVTLFVQNRTTESAADASSSIAPGHRMALVIGNAGYQRVPKLRTPVNDAIAIGAVFKSAGFNTMVRIDQPNSEFRRSLRTFAEATRDAEIAVTYFAGYGLSTGDDNYLIPTDARLASAGDLEDEAISLVRMLAEMHQAKRLRLLILDASRENPFLASMRVSGSRKIERGTSRVDPSSVDTLIAYAAKAGSIAGEGVGPNSPYTTALLKHLVVPGLDIRLAFGRVRDDVLKATGMTQEPFVYGSLRDGAIVPLSALPSSQAKVSEDDIRRDFELVLSIDTIRAWDIFLATHPTGYYADLARAQLAKLKEKELRR
jgi:hypothetical protein